MLSCVIEVDSFGEGTALEMIAIGVRPLYRHSRRPTSRARHSDSTVSHALSPLPAPKAVSKAVFSAAAARAGRDDPPPPPAGHYYELITQAPTDLSSIALRALRFNFRGVGKIQGS